MAKRTLSSTLKMRLDPAMRRELDRLADREQVSTSVIVRRACRLYLAGTTTK